MASFSRSAQGSKESLKHLAEMALALLKLTNKEIPMQDSNLQSKAQEAEQSAEELLAALQNSEDLAVENYGREIARLEKEVKETDWSKYRRKRP